MDLLSKPIGVLERQYLAKVGVRGNSGFTALFLVFNGLLFDLFMFL